MSKKMSLQITHTYDTMYVHIARAKVSGKLIDSLTPEFAASDQAYKLAYMFNGSTGLADTSGLYLDDIALTQSCYKGMFSGCKTLTSTPALPAASLKDECYFGMFSNCTNLSTPPVLPATNIAASCYYNMFYGCTVLTSAPALPASKLANDCYSHMFVECNVWLSTMSELPAVELA